jgi:hypothetical protein
MIVSSVGLPVVSTVSASVIAHVSELAVDARGHAARADHLRIEPDDLHFYYSGGSCIPTGKKRLWNMNLCSLAHVYGEQTFLGMNLCSMYFQREGAAGLRKSSKSEK